MHRGAAGAGALNTRLQQRLTPSREGGRRSGGPVGGCSGSAARSPRSATTTTRAKQTLTVRTDEDEPIDYDFDEIDELAHPYAMTIAWIRRCSSTFCGGATVPLGSLSTPAGFHAPGLRSMPHRCGMDRPL